MAVAVLDVTVLDGFRGRTKFSFIPAQCAGLFIGLLVDSTPLAAVMDSGAPIIRSADAVVLRHFRLFASGRRTRGHIPGRTSPTSSDFGIIYRHPVGHAQALSSVANRQEPLLEARSALSPLSRLATSSIPAPVSLDRGRKPASRLTADNLAVALPQVFDNRTRVSQVKGSVDVKFRRSARKPHRLQRHRSLLSNPSIAYGLIIHVALFLIATQRIHRLQKMPRSPRFEVFILLEFCVWTVLISCKSLSPPQESRTRGFKKS